MELNQYLRLLYEDDGNPIHAIDTFHDCMEGNHPIPEWVNKCFHQIFVTYFQEKNEKSLDELFKLTGKTSGRAPVKKQRIQKLRDHELISCMVLLRQFSIEVITVEDAAVIAMNYLQSKNPESRNLKDKRSLMNKYYSVEWERLSHFPENMDYVIWQWPELNDLFSTIPSELRNKYPNIFPSNLK